MPYGLTATGFSRKRLPEIKSDLETALVAAFGNINLEPDSLFSQLIGVIAQLNADLWEAAEEVYLATYPASAEGFSLDNVAQLLGVVRLAESYSAVQAALWGNNGVVVPINTRVSVVDSNEPFLLQAEVIIGMGGNLAGALVTVLVSEPSTTYTITINGVDHSYVNGDPGAEVEVIASELAEEINSGSEPVIATTDGAEIEIHSEDGETSFTISVSDSGINLEISKRASFGTFQAQNVGAVLAPAETLTQIETPVTGLDSVINYMDATVGRETETDAELRERRAASLMLAGAATFEAIRSHLLQDVDGVTAVEIEENRTDTTVGDLTPHSFRCVVQGGEDQDIGDKLWELKPAGIETIGDVEVLVVDSQEDTQAVYFSRPETINIRLDVFITYNSEETFPTDGLAAIETAILAQAAELEIGENVIPQKFYAAIYSVAGIATATITWELGSGAGTPPYANGSDDVIEIAADQVANFTATQVTVRDA